MAADPLDIIAGICHEQPHDALTQIAEALGYTEQREQERTQREQTLAGLLKRCARCLPPGHATRVLATDYLRQHGYLSPLRAPGVGWSRQPHQPGQAVPRPVHPNAEGRLGRLQGLAVRAGRPARRSGPVLRAGCGSHPPGASPHDVPDHRAVRGCARVMENAMPCQSCQNPTLCTDRCEVYAEQLRACEASGQMDSRQVSAHVEAGEMPRSCTCHPDDNPPKPCARKYAFSECIVAPKGEAGEMEAAKGDERG